MRDIEEPPPPCEDAHDHECDDDVEDPPARDEHDGEDELAAACADGAASCEEEEEEEELVVLGAKVVCPICLEHVHVACTGGGQMKPRLPPLDDRPPEAAKFNDFKHDFKVFPVI